MRSGFARLPLLLTISALTLGMPLLLYGLVLTATEVLAIIEARTLYAGPHLGLAVGPVFMLVGISFLWPLRPYQH
jgi:hypothetical protein